MSADARAWLVSTPFGGLLNICYYVGYSSFATDAQMLNVITSNLLRCNGVTFFFITVNGQILSLKCVNQIGRCPLTGTEQGCINDGEVRAPDLEMD